MSASTSGTPPPKEPREKNGSSAVGAVLDGKYRLLRLLREGGMGSVYEAVHLDVDRPVAVKLLRRDRSTDDHAHERFRREARAAGRIGHDNICETLDFGHDGDDNPYLVMPLLRGRSLAEAIRHDGPLTITRSLDIAVQLLAGLDAAHAAGIIHRDLKPENIFLTTLGDREDFVKILDFGISKTVHSPTLDGDAESITSTGAVLGTAYYMSPEQARGLKQIDPRADLYAVGVILYEMLTAHRAVEGDSYNDVLWRIWNEPIQPPRAHRPDLPLPLQRVILKALSKEPEKRHASAQAMREALLAASDDEQQGTACAETQETVDATGDSEAPLDIYALDTTIEPADGGLRRGRTTLIAVAVTFVVLFGGGAALLLNNGANQTEGDDSDGTSHAALVREPTDPGTDAGHSADSVADEGAQSPPTEQRRGVLELRGLPEGAVITVAGQRVHGPRVELPAGDGEVEVVIRAAGHETWRRRFAATEDHEVDVELLPAPVATAAPSPRHGAPRPRPATTKNPRPPRREGVSSFGQMP